MLLINNITSDPLQLFTFTGLPGIQIPSVLRFLPRVEKWIINVNYLTEEIDGIAVVASPNFLRQWRNLIPFGMACVRPDGLDPYAIDDFSQGLAKLYLLNADEVAAVETQFYSG